MSETLTIRRDDLRRAFVAYFDAQFQQTPTAEDWYAFARIIDGSAAEQPSERSALASAVAGNVSHSISRMTYEEAVQLATEIADPDFIETYAAMKRQLQEH